MSSKNSPPILLISMGTSPAVVAEAFLLPGVRFGAVHVLTTEKTSLGLLPEFFDQVSPGLEWSVTRVADFIDLNSEEDHFRFEEVLYRWMTASAPDPRFRCVCLSGGFKTMSASMGRAASILGAREVFHVLAHTVHRDSGGRSGPPETTEEILDAQTRGGLHWIWLGPEPGWPQIRGWATSILPLTTVRKDGREQWVKAADMAFRDRVQVMTDRARHITDAWDQVSVLPFPELATWSAADLCWLREPLDPALDQSWVQALPKVELHCHLGGFATSGPALEGVRAAAMEPHKLPPMEERPFPQGWPLPDQPWFQHSDEQSSLKRYMALGDNNGSKLLRDPGCLKAQCRNLYAALVADGVTYAEIRCSPNNYADADRSRGRSAWTVLQDIRDHFQTAMSEARTAWESGGRSGSEPCRVNLIIIATRKDSGDRSDIARHLALAITAADAWSDAEGVRVVGVDLAGFENKDTRAALFETDFAPVHRVGLAVTVHAGENDDAEGIWQAVFKLNARRLGHALHLHQSPDLLRAVADRGIGVEMCPYANVQIKGFWPVNGQDRYPLGDYLTQGVRVGVNSDNLGISAASLSDNLLLLGRLCPGLTRMDLLRLVRNAVDTAFLPASQRYQLATRVAAALPGPPGKV